MELFIMDYSSDTLIELLSSSVELNESLLVLTLV